jgi:S1-C subfamily serine protease
MRQLENLIALTLLGLILSPASGAEPLSRLFERANPAVVVIYTTETVLSGPSPDKSVSVSGLGSGVLISGDELLTAAHVVHAADSLEVEFPDGTRVPADVISSSPRADVALLQLHEPAPSSILPPKLGDSDEVSVGDEVFVIGAPYGISHTLTRGIISGRHRNREASGGMEETDFFQTDAAINQGNSGGPMFNLEGEIIGIVSHIKSKTGSNVGLGFAVTSNMARHLMLDQPPFYTGFESVTIRGPMARALNLEQPIGILVQRVAARSFADRLGLIGGSIPIKVAGESIRIGGDIIIEVQGISTSEKNALERMRNRVQSLEVGDLLTVKVLRAGRIVELSAHVLI